MRRDPRPMGLPGRQQKDRYRYPYGQSQNYRRCHHWEARRAAQH